MIFIGHNSPLSNNGYCKSTSLQKNMFLDDERMQDGLGLHLSKSEILVVINFGQAWQQRYNYEFCIHVSISKKDLIC